MCFKLKNSVFILLFTVISGFSQSKRIELIRADALEGTTYNNEPVRKLSGNVVFKQEDAQLFCDLSYQFINRNDLEAFSNIRILKGEGQSIINGEKMMYFGDAKLAKITGSNIILNSKTLYLYTTVLDYNTQADISNYYNGGKVIDDVNTLTSNFGTYFKQQDLFVFIKNVVFKDGKHTIYTDSLDYNTVTRIVKFRGPTTIIGPDGIMNSTKGEYNSATKQSDFHSKSTIYSKDYSLTADKLYYNQFTKYGLGIGNVVLISIKDSVTVFGDYGQYWGDKGHTKVYPQALMQSVSNAGKDTTFLRADTLLSINDTIKKEKRLLAYNHVFVYDKKNMQAICDSLVNDVTDSTTTFFNDPVIWNGKNQMRGDTIKAYLMNKKIHQIKFRTKAFIISKDTLENFNQVKGKNMVAYFDSSRIKRVEVLENAESIYYALQEDTATNGLNKAEAVNMTIRFKNQKVKTISFYKKPKALFIPIHEINDDVIRLRGFKWREAERPNLMQVLGKYYVSEKKRNIIKVKNVYLPTIKNTLKKKKNK